MRRTLMKRSQTIFYGLFLFSLLFSAVYLAARRGAGLEGFIFDGGGNLFGDFINNLHYPTHEGGPYFDSVWATFPPLAYTFYYLFNVAFTRANYAYELLAYTMITAATAVLMLYAVQRIFERYRGREGAAGRGAALCLCLLHPCVSWNMLVCFACQYLIQLAAMADALAAFRRNKKQIAAAPLKGGME